MAHPRRISPEMILKAARASLERRGSLQLADIASRLGVSSPSLYEYFSSMEALRDELVRSGFLMLGETLRAAVSREATLSSLGHAYREFAVTHPRLYDLMREPGTGKVRGFAISRFVIQLIADVLGMPVDDPGFIGVSRIVWSFLHGFVSLGQAGQFHAGGDFPGKFDGG